MKQWMACLIMFISLMLSIPSHAEDVKKNEVPEAIMEEVVVTATRQEEKISSVPANATVITETDIKNSTARDIPDLLRNQVGVHVDDITGNKRSFTVDLRSFGETASLNTLVLVDGRRINLPDLSGTDWSLIPLDRVKRIEIVRGGSGSVLYGDNAGGGVINIITKEGGQFKTGAEISGGSYDTMKGSAFVSGTQNKLSYALSGSYLTSDGYRDNSDTEAKDLGLDLGYYQNDYVKWNFSSGFHKDSTGLPGAIKASEFESGVSRTDSLHPNDFADVKDYYFKCGPEIYFLSNSEFKVDLSFRKRNSQSFSSFSGGSFTLDTNIKTIIISPQIAYREKVFGLDNRLILGFDFENDDEDIVQEYGVSETFKLEKENYGYYIHDEIKPKANLSVSAGYRYDRGDFKFQPSTPENKTMDENLFTAGVNYKFCKLSSVYFSYSRSFRYPVLDEFFDSYGKTINTSLVPQTSNDYELGTRFYLTPTFYANLNVFRIDTKNEIFFNPISYTNENLDGKTRRDGFEISLTKNFANISITGNYKYTDATIIGGEFDGNKVPNVPKHLASFNALIPLKYGLSFVLNGTYVGKRPFISDFSNEFEKQEEYFVLNTKVRYKWNKIAAFMDINNILNKKYSEYGALALFSTPVETAFYPSPEINFLIGVSAEF
jgi:iron complex outermembrane receptor protein